MKENEYQCAMCGKVYKKKWSDEEAWEEHDSNFPGESHETAAIVCDDCYKKMVAVRPRKGCPQRNGKVSLLIGHGGGTYYTRYFQER